MSNTKRVHFSNTNQVITIDEIDSIIQNRNKPNQDVKIPIKNNYSIKQNYKQINSFRKIVLGIVIFLLAIILFFQLKSRSFNF